MVLKLHCLTHPKLYLLLTTSNFLGSGEKKLKATQNLRLLYVFSYLVLFRVKGMQVFACFDDLDVLINIIIEKVCAFGCKNY